MRHASIATSWIKQTLLSVTLVAAGCASPQRAAPLPGGGLSDLIRLQPGRAGRASTSAPDWRNTNQDAREIAAGETLVVADLVGPGMINHIWTTVAPGDLAYGRLLVIRMYWDGEETPSVVCPLGDFFAVGHGLDADVNSAVVTVTSHGRARNCYWPMPFRKSAKITITNEGTRRTMAFFWQADWRKLPELPADTPYFHAHYRQEHPAVMGRNYRIADIQGRGHYVGTVLSVRQHTGNWWGEGDDFFFIDGETEPSIKGTGSEDYFNDAWGLRQSSLPYFGAPICELNVAMARMTAYRWHIVDPVPFDKSLRVEIEHKGVTFNDDGSVASHFAERADDFSSVAFWYQLEPHAAMEPLPPAAARIYHDMHAIIEAEELVEADRVETSAGDTNVQWGPWSNARQLQWFTTRIGDEITFMLNVPADGRYTLNSSLTLAANGGTFQPLLNGQPLGGPIDLYTPTFHNRDFQFAGLDLTAGMHRLTFRCIGANPASGGGLAFGVDCFLLTPEQ